MCPGLNNGSQPIVLVKYRQMLLIYNVLYTYIVLCHLTSIHLSLSLSLFSISPRSIGEHLIYIELTFKTPNNVFIILIVLIDYNIILLK